MNKTLGPKLGPKVDGDAHHAATVHESMQQAHVGHDVGTPALLGHSWNRPMPPGGSAEPHHLGTVVNGMGHVQVFHVAPHSAGSAVAAGSAARTTSAAQPKQYMAVKTAKTPYQVDHDELHAQRQRYLASGMSDHEATAKALNHHDVVLYEGDGAGNFRRVPA